MARLTLAQQIAQLGDTAPLELSWTVDINPEEDFITPRNESDVENDEGPENNSAAREHYVSVGPSAIRNLQPSVSDPKYEGLKTSRQRIFEDDDDITSPGGSDNPGEMSVEDSDPEDDDGEEQPSAEDEGAEDDGHSPSPDYELPSRPNNEISTQKEVVDVTTSLQQSRSSDRIKGKAIARQIEVWEALVDARIRLQKGLAASNRLPHPNQLPSFVSSPDGDSATLRLLTEASQLSNSIHELQEVLLRKQSLNVPPRKRRRVDESEEAAKRDFEEEITSASKEFADLESWSHPHLVQTLLKWSHKIQSVSPATLLPSKKTAFRQHATPKSVVDLVHEAAEEGRSKAIGRTRIYRGTSSGRIGAASSSSGAALEPSLFRTGQGDAREELPAVEGDAEIFDDTDFYQDILRDVIDSKTNVDGLAGEAWASKARKIKKAVDTKASKGRKLRYEVHEKIQNFMVPIPAKGTWHEEQIDELFASLLGKGFSSTESRSLEETRDPSFQQTIVDAEPALAGLRVF